MKKIISALTCLIFLSIFIAFPSPLSAEKKQINIVGALGIASEQFDEALFDLGVEIELTKGLFFQALINTHMGGDRYYGDPYYPYYYYDTPIVYGYGRYISFSANGLHGLTTFGVYKISFSKKIRFYGKAGVNFLFYDKYDSMDDRSQYYKESQSGFGAGFGAGFEYSISPKNAIVLGGTYKYMFQKEFEKPEDIKRTHPSWSKFYIGASYRLK